MLLLLRHFISKDEYTEHHSYRVSVYASRIAAHLALSADRIEDVRAAGLLHDIGKLDISRDLLYKAAQFTREEYAGNADSTWTRAWRCWKPSADRCAG